ncbi:MAG: toxin-antitoxin system TumE family protein [Allorhizobium sp.]
MAKARLVRRARYFLRDGIFIEMLIWRVPASIKGSAHHFKYSLALVADGNCVLRYDNEAGKGDHRHLGDKEIPYEFKSMDVLIADFQVDVEGWLNDNPEGEDRES